MHERVKYFEGPLKEKRWVNNCKNFNTHLKHIKYHSHPISKHYYVSYEYENWQNKNKKNSNRKQTYKQKKRIKTDNCELYIMFEVLLTEIQLVEICFERKSSKTMI